ncbi:MAG: hypothetical protein J6I84_04180 [Bacilli bacterium]|nr:hypothetical protein [Bacilli bacterium]
MNYTTLEQSKKLLELGLNPKSADMWYQHTGISIKDGSQKPIYFPMIIRDNESDDDIPCWTVGALLEIMPDEIYPKDYKDIPFWGFSPGLHKVHHSYDGMDFGTSYYMRYTSEDDGDDRVYKEFEEDTPIKAVYKMVVWLLENKII